MADLGNATAARPVGGNSAMAAVENYNLVFCRRESREGHYVAQCQPVMTIPAVACTKEAASLVNISVACEVKQGDLGIILEKGFDRVSKQVAFNSVVSAGAG